MYSRWLYYTALGDSISAGVGAYLRDGFVKAYHHKLEHHLRLPVYLHLYAQPRITSYQLLTFLYDPNVRRDIARAHIITINIGGNDLIQANKRYKEIGDPQVLEQSHYYLYNNVKQILSVIHEIKANEPQNYLIQLIGIYNPYPKLPYSDHWIGKTNESLYQLATSYKNTVYIDVYPVFQQNGKGLFSFGGIHPNGKGHQMIADELLRSYFDYLSYLSSDQYQQS
ncbi:MULTISPECIES: GDSL-type esterase/lipase family protein [Bacillaceae]|uniref:SGNH hydrolase-type esterase domain-containing protein n=1 Tax=Evansella alkalicola TaxID=745819 RepID=A0ABS6JXR4_9BACI|nr:MULTISPECIES: GDSL-type esterase/lipase family protein [Bacillaceae]MBU9723380.1 hypothetical protein [Bacillus alkalicola]